MVGTRTALAAGMVASATGQRRAAIEALERLSAGGMDRDELERLAATLAYRLVAHADHTAAVAGICVELALRQPCETP